MFGTKVAKQAIGLSALYSFTSYLRLKSKILLILMILSTKTPDLAARARSINDNG